MWKKEENSSTDFLNTEPAPSSAPTDFSPSSDEAIIGPSIKINGDLRGNENLLIEGEVEGSIDLPKNTVTVGSTGKVKATIKAGVIIVEGRVEGDLHGSEQIEVRQSGNVLGNIVAPRVGLEDGAQFKGNIDMEPKQAVKFKPAASANAKAKPAEKNESGAAASKQLSG